MLAFVIAAILTPTPDVINQTLMAIPMLLFYEVGIWVLVFFERKRERELARELPKRPSKRSWRDGSTSPGNVVQTVP